MSNYLNENLEGLLSKMSYEKAKELYKSYVLDDLRGVRVSLTKDLSQYHPQLVIGALGVLSGVSRQDERAKYIKFDDFNYNSVIYSDNYDIVDEEFLLAADIIKYKKLSAIVESNKVVLGQGPRGGFKYLSVEYINEDGICCHESMGGNIGKMYLEELKKTDVHIDVKII